MVQVTFPRISSRIVIPKDGIAETEWYLFFERLWDRTGGDTDLVLGVYEVEFVAGTGLDGGGYMTSSTINFSLSDTPVVPGTYGSGTNIPVFTVDQQGRLTAVSSVPYTLPVASDILYDNSVSGLTADDVQEAIDELKAEIDVLGGDFFVNLVLRTGTGVLLDVGDGSFLDIGNQ